MKTGFLDIETNGLLADMLDYSTLPYKLNPEAKIWVVSLTDMKTMTTKSLVKEEITKENLDNLLKEYDVIVAHNGHKFDMIALKLFGLIDYKVGYLGEEDMLNNRPVRLIDTLIMSRLSNPDRLGGHSLASWGERTGIEKTDYRGELIELGVIDRSLPKGQEFSFFHPLMVKYCEQDTVATAYAYFEILKEYKGYTTSKMPLQIEHKLADLAIRRETFGFELNKELALSNLEWLTSKMEELASNVNPHLPKKKFTKTKLSEYTPPSTQFKKDGTLSVHMTNFLKKFEEHISKVDVENKFFIYKGVMYEMPHEYPLEWEEEATIDDLDIVKHKLIELGWEPSEWKERDLTKDAKKQNLSVEKRIKALEKYVKETLEGKYKQQRLDILGVPEDHLLSFLMKDIRGNRAVKVPTSPCIKVGVTKEMCPKLIELGDKVSFAKDVADYYTYRHRKSAIAGGDIVDMDFDEDVPETGYLAQVREQDGRIPTPAIEIGASCVIKGSLLTTNKGLKCITEVNVGDSVLTHTGVYKKIIDKIDNGIKNIFKVTLKNGMSLTCTSNHPFWTTNGWVICEQLDYETEVYCYGENETWRQHPVFKNYEGSSTGLVRNKKGKILNPLTSKISGNPYTIDLYDGSGKKSRRSVGKFIIECFKGLTPNGLEVLHNDGNNTNNNLENLRFGTSKENSEDSLKHGYVKKIRKSRDLKLTDGQVEEIREFQRVNIYEKGQDSYLSKIYNVSREHIRDIRLGKRRVLTPVDSLYVESFLTSTVVSVERVGVDNTYDITVEEDHSYVVNSIVTHNTNRYKHIGVANVPRASSLFGKEMRSLFGAGKGRVQFGFDYASLEARIEGHYIYDYEGGAEMAVSLLAEKPFDIHTLSSQKLGIKRDDAKSVNYAILYGASANKFVKMLGYTKPQATKFVDDWWDLNSPLKDLKADKDLEWMQSGKKYITSIDGRRINIRSQHSILNALFQSAGVICAKYITIFMCQRFEELGYCIDVFKGDPDIAMMIEYHDENQLATKKDLLHYKVFDSEEEAKLFKETWVGDQLGAIQSGKNGKFYITMPNVISKTITQSIEKVENMFNMKVNLGYEFVTGNNWFDCH